MRTTFARHDGSPEPVIGITVENRAPEYGFAAAERLAAILDDLAVHRSAVRAVVDLMQTWAVSVEDVQVEIARRA